MLVCSPLVAVGCDRVPAERPAQTLSVHDAWARPADSGATTALYFILTNSGVGQDTIINVSSTEADATEMHVSTRRGGMMHMSRVTALTVPAGDSVSFRPLGGHVMMMGLRRVLAANDTVVATLTFASGQQVTVRADVRQP